MIPGVTFEILALIVSVLGAIAAELGFEDSARDAAGLAALLVVLGYLVDLLSTCAGLLKVIAKLLPVVTLGLVPDLSMLPEPIILLVLMVLDTIFAAPCTALISYIREVVMTRARTFSGLGWWY